MEKISNLKKLETTVTYQANTEVQLITCNIKVIQKDSNFIPFAFYKFSKYDCHMFFKDLVDKKNDKVEFDIIRRTNKEYISVANGCIIEIPIIEDFVRKILSLIKLEIIVI